MPGGVDPRQAWNEAAHQTGDACRVLEGPDSGTAMGRGKGNFQFKQASLSLRKLHSLLSPGTAWSIWQSIMNFRRKRGKVGGGWREGGRKANCWISSLCLFKSLQRNVKWLVLAASLGYFLTSKCISGCSGQMLSSAWWNMPFISFTFILLTFQHLFLALGRQPISNNLCINWGKKEQRPTN